jgi:Ni,Fe-hydrogenase III large subunit
MAPAHQGLGAEDDARFDIDLRLVMQQQFTRIDCLPQLVLELKETGRLFVHARGEELVVIATASLGGVHRGIRVLHQLQRFEAVVRKHADAD